MAVCNVEWKVTGSRLKMLNRLDNGNIENENAHKGRPEISDCLQR